MVFAKLAAKNISAFEFNNNKRTCDPDPVTIIAFSSLTITDKRITNEMQHIT